MTKTIVGNARPIRIWGVQTGAGRTRTIRQQRHPQKPWRQRLRGQRIRSRRQQGRGLFSSIGSSTVDRAIRQFAPALIDKAATRFTQAGKEITDNAINQLIDIPKNGFLGAVRDIKKAISTKNKNLIDRVKRQIMEVVQPSQ